MHAITISRQTGSLGDEIAAGLSEKLGMKLITRETVMSEWLTDIASGYELRMLAESPKFYLNSSKADITFKNYLEKRLMEEAEKSTVIIIGMGAQVILAGLPGVLNIRITAPDKVRLQRIHKQYGLTGNEAQELLDKSDRRHKRYISALYGKDWADIQLYDLTLNTGLLGIDECIQAISSILSAREKALEDARREASETVAAEAKSKAPVFKHPAEKEFAEILDMYSIKWEYEPKTFPLEWDAEGNVTMAFSPDFYLTRFDAYIELTTMEQKYVTVKNKKVRRLKELYPGINIKIVYKKDFHSLIKRFGAKG